MYGTYTIPGYDFPTAKVLDGAGIPLLLVGDSVGMARRLGDESEGLVGKNGDDHRNDHARLFDGGGIELLAKGQRLKASTYLSKNSHSNPYSPSTPTRLTLGSKETISLTLVPASCSACPGKVVILRTLPPCSQ